MKHHSGRYDDRGRGGARDEYCTFYMKVGACRHGDNCSRGHPKPRISRTVMIPNVFNSAMLAEQAPSARLQAEAFDQFVIDWYEEVQRYGEVDDMAVLDNGCQHLMGNVYVNYFHEDDADKCLRALQGRFYAGNECTPEFVRVNGFGPQCRCRMYDVKTCDRAETCNYMHIRRARRGLMEDLSLDQPFRGHRSNAYGHGNGRYGDHGRSERDYRRRESRNRSRSPNRSRSRSPRRSRSRSPRHSRSRSPRRSLSRSRSPDHRQNKNEAVQKSQSTNDAVAVPSSSVRSRSRSRSSKRSSPSCSPQSTTGTLGLQLRASSDTSLVDSMLGGL